MDLKSPLTSMILIIAGGLLLSQQYPEGIETMKWIGWIPLVFGLIILGLFVKKEIIA